MKGDTVNVRRSVRVKTKVPWMPPGKTSCRESSYKWEVGKKTKKQKNPPYSQASSLGSSQGAGIRRIFWGYFAQTGWLCLSKLAVPKLYGLAAWQGRRGEPARRLYKSSCGVRTGLTLAQAELRITTRAARS